MTARPGRVIAAAAPGPFARRAPVAACSAWTSCRSRPACDGSLCRAMHRPAHELAPVDVQRVWAGSHRPVVSAGTPTNGGASPPAFEAEVRQRADLLEQPWRSLLVVRSVTIGYARRAGSSLINLRNKRRAGRSKSPVRASSPDPHADLTVDLNLWRSAARRRVLHRRRPVTDCCRTSP